MISAVLLIVYGVCSYFFASPDQRLVLNPVILSAVIILAMIEYFWRRDRQLPIVDIGTLCAVVTLVYSAIPVVFYVKAGLKFGPLSDPRLVTMATAPADVADFLWFVTAYIAALSISYSLLRGAGMPGPRIEIEASPNAGWALLAIFLLAAIYQIGVEHIFHVQLNPAVGELQQDTIGKDFVVLPRLVGQITHNVLAIGQIAMLGLVAFVFARKSPMLGLALAAYVLADAAYSMISGTGTPPHLLMLMMTAVLCCHRLLRPIAPLSAAATVIVVLAGLVGYGYFRQGTTDGVSDFWSATNEFQQLMANGINISWEKARGGFRDLPWQLPYNDLIMMVPQQLLPFRKFDLAQWYVEQMGGGKTPTGLMFGVVTQSKLGFGLPEIIVRGALLGAVLAVMHRQCVKHASSLTVLIIYLWLCAWIHFTYRATTFFVATWAIYRLIPFVLLFWLLRRLFRSRTKVVSSNAGV